jgi:signal-transduction protein with cAMP-binding, CBS, and nucleotidyltransferase domain
LKCPSWSRRVKLAFDWTWELLFPRDLGHARTNQTERISRAHYRSGDTIFLEGTPGTHFYVIDRGEVEILRRDDRGQPNQIVDVLGPGEFFGEVALLDNQPRGITARARTEVDALVMGKEVFSRISGSLAPFRLLLAQSLRWKHAKLNPRIHQAWQAIQQQPLSAFLEPVPAHRLSPHDTYETTVRAFDQHALEWVCVLDQEERLQGVVTRSELFGAFEQGRGPETNVEDFMLTNPLVVTPDESPLTVAELMHKHDSDWMPVVEDKASRRVVGVIRSERMLRSLIQQEADTARQS